jgi:GNAT superfamily N-acetyltransferase
LFRRASLSMIAARMPATPQPSQVRDEEIVVGACGPEHREEQASLFKQCFKKPIDGSALAWRYDSSPHGPSLSFLARAPSGDAVSGYACSPRRALVRGDEATLASIGETGDVMTHSDWRKRGFFSRLDRAAMDAAKARGWPMCFGLPNRRSAHIFLELGWSAIGTVRSWTFVLHADAHARAARAREGRWKGWLTPLDARTCTRGRAKLDAARAAFRRASLDRFPPEVVELSRAVERKFGLMVRRDAESLNWRFVRTPSRLHRAIGVFEGAELAGYVVVQLPRKDSGIGYLVDVLGRDDRAVLAAIGEGLTELENEGASVVEATAIDGTWWNARLVDSGFLAPRADNHLTVILHVHDEKHPLVAAARDVRSWYFTDGDRDDETMG